MRTLPLSRAGVALLALLPWMLAAAAAPREISKTPFDFVYLGEGRPVLYRLHIFVDGKPLQAAWDEFVQHVFDSLDVNKDGVLSRDEAEAVPVASVLFAGNQVGVNFGQPAAGQLDKNNDGKVTRDELAAYYRSNGAAPFQIQLAQTQNDNFAIAFGADGRRLGGESTADLNERMFELLDANKDGKLSADELAAAPAVLLRRDANDDEMVASNELVNAPSTNDYVLAQRMLIDGAQPRISNFLVVTSEEALTSLGRQLRDFYAPRGKTAPSKNPTRATMKLDEAAFTQLDADGNGELDAEELSRFARRPADVELIVRLGKDADGQPSVEIVSGNVPSSLAASLRARPGGASLDLGTTRLDLTAGGRDSNMRLNVSNRQIYKMQFSMADQDNNGYLDRAEASRNGLFANSFRAMDRDGDGMLFEKEMLAYLDQVEGLQAKAAAGCCTLNISDQGKGLFDLLDSNRDGRLGVREMRNAVKQIENLDRDGDGCIAKDEIPRSYQLALRRGGVSSGQTGGRVVIAAQGINRGGPRSAEPMAGPVWFRKMDRNRDGDVSRREFLGTEEEFKRLDADGDGLISVEEAERAQKAER